MRVRSVLLMKPTRSFSTRAAQCLSEGRNVTNYPLSLPGFLQPTQKMFFLVCNLLSFNPLNRYLAECLLGHCCRQPGRRREPDVRPERGGGGEGEEETRQVKGKVNRQENGEYKFKPVLGLMNIRSERGRKTFWKGTYSPRGI